MPKEEVKKIQASELQSYLGKRVDTRQLKDILDIYIILTDVITVSDKFHRCYMEGTLDCYSKNSIKLTKLDSTLVFNSSLERCEY